MDKTLLEGVRGNSGDDIYITYEDGREILVCECEGGYNAGCVDLLDLIEWLRVNRPELLIPPVSQ